MLPDIRGEVVKPHMKKVITLAAWTPIYLYFTKHFTESFIVHLLNVSNITNSGGVKFVALNTRCFVVD